MVRAGVGRDGGGRAGLELLAFCKRSNCIIPEFVRDHSQSVGLPFVEINILIWFLIG